MLAFVAAWAPFGLHLRDHLKPRRLKVPGSWERKGTPACRRASGSDGHKNHTGARTALGPLRTGPQAQHLPPLAGCSTVLVSFLLRKLASLHVAFDLCAQPRERPRHRTLDRGRSRGDGAGSRDPGALMLRARSGSVTAFAVAAW